MLDSGFSPIPPKWFLKLLGDTDHNLVIYWNPFKACWIIDRKVDGEVNTTVLVCKADNGDALPLNENLIDRIRSMDAWKSYGSYEAFHAANMAREKEAKDKIDADIRENYRLASLDDKAQLNQAYTLIKRHDVARINQ